MKKLLALLTLALVVFLVLHRQRVFLWDPIATVTRDGVKQGGVRVMINYSNDILVEDRNVKAQKFYLVQNWDKTAKYSVGRLKCIQYMACMTEADQAPGETFKPGPLGGRANVTSVTMTNKSVTFVDESGALVQVALR